MSKPQCGRCGKMAAAEDRFCTKCGAELSGNGSSSIPSELAPWTGHSAPVTSLAISSDGSRLLSGSEDGTARLWDSSTGREVLRLDGSGLPVTSVGFSPDQSRAIAASSSDDRVRLFNLAGGTYLGSLAGHASFVSSIAWSPDGRTIWSDSSDMTVRVWDAISGAELRRLKGHANDISCVGVSPDGRWAASGSLDETVRLWEPSTGRLVAVLGDDDNRFRGMFHALAFSPDSRWLVACTLSADVFLWEVGTAREIRRFDGHTGNVFAVAWTSDGRRIVTASGTDFWDDDMRKEHGTDNTCRVWDVASGMEVQRYAGHSGNVNAVACTPDGSSCFSAGKEGTIHRWPLNS